MARFTVAEIARLCDATLEGGGANRDVVGPATLVHARPDEVSFLGNPRYEAELQTTRAAAVLVPSDLVVERDDLTLLRCANPSRAFTRIIEAFRPAEERPPAGVHATAFVEAGATVPEDAFVGPHVTVGADAVLGSGVVLHAGVHVGARSRVGAGSILHPGVVLYHDTVVGERCVLHAGCVLGSDGFGFEPTATGWEKIPQCGTVEVGDDVEIGANVTVDRGRFHATRIRSGGKIDDLVHVAHNVDVGEHTLLLAQVGIAGSSKLGKQVILAGQVGVAGHVEVGDGARISAQSGVSKNLPGGKDYYGTPAKPRREGLRQIAALGKVEELRRRVEELEARLREATLQTGERAEAEA